MKLIAIHAVHGRKVLRPADARNKDRGRSAAIVAKPGEEFDTVEFGIDNDEAARLIALGAARRKMREVTDADEAAGGAPQA
jgi:hypothetical protein